MNFDYTPEQNQLRREVRDFATREIAPHVLEWDENQTFPLEVIKKLGELGYMGSIFPEESRASMDRWESSWPRILHFAAITFTKPEVKSRSSGISPSSRLANGSAAGH
jgi:alkylation response protein AidB-like acyl-CoA dehydrogenase